MKIKTEELTGLPLRYAVAVAEGATNLEYDTVATYWVTLNGKDRALGKGWSQSFMPDTDWSQGGPIIERERIVVAWGGNIDCAGEDWHAGVCDGIDLGGGVMLRRPWCSGPTPLVSAMRCYVASVMGDEVEIPEELR